MRVVAVATAETITSAVARALVEVWPGRVLVAQAPVARVLARLVRVRAWTKVLRLVARVRMRVVPALQRSWLGWAVRAVSPPTAEAPATRAAVQVALVAQWAQLAMLLRRARW